jgi:sugar lactone lactonase YvrE
MFLVEDHFVNPNGLVFSERERTYYIEDFAYLLDPSSSHHFLDCDVG